MLGNSLLGIIALIVTILIVLLLPVKLAAGVMGAKRSGLFWSAVALIGTTILHSFGLTVPLYGSLVAFVFSGIGFSLILGATFWGGMGIALLHIVFSALIFYLFSLLGFVALAGLTLF